VVASILITAVAAPLLEMKVKVGLLAGIAAMLGDLFSSFLKRRIKLEPSSKAIGLDQIPESLLPLLAGRQAFSLTATDILVGTGLFFIGEQLLSRLLFKFHIRDHPY
jgi:hypothetical protein